MLIVPLHGWGIIAPSNSNLLPGLCNSNVLMLPISVLGLHREVPLDTHKNFTGR